MKDFKIRASQCGQIMGIKGLGKTGQTYCETWLKEQLYNRKKTFSSKYTDKGNIMEDASLDFIAEQLGYGMLIKNEKQKENDYITGTPDVVLNDLIIDVKNSWDPFSFPLFDIDVPNNAYYWQAQCYMELFNIDNYKLIYVISDTPVNLIEKEAYYWCKDNGYDELDLDIYKQFIRKMTYQDVDSKLKLKSFDIKRNPKDIEKVIERVWECRNYISKLLKTIN